METPEMVPEKTTCPTCSACAACVITPTVDAELTVTVNVFNVWN